MNTVITIVFILMITLFHQNFGFKTKITILQKNEIFVSEFDQQTIEDKDGDMPEKTMKSKTKAGMRKEQLDMMIIVVILMLVI